MQNIVPVVNERKVKQENGSEVILSLEQLIKSHVESIDRLTVEKRKQAEMLKDGCNNDLVYREHADKAKEAAKVRNATKAQIMKQPAMVLLSNKVKSITSELKDKKMALSEYLLEYQRLTQATQLELFDGQILEIVKTAKVIKTTYKK